jgi:uncharacterized protein YbaA (DUF1428 family)
MSNPNLNQVLGENEELFKHAWLQKHLFDNHGMVIALECYDRDLTEKDVTQLKKMIRAREEKLKTMFQVDYVEIDDYTN